MHGPAQPGELGPESQVYRTGFGTAYSVLGSARVMEFGLRVTLSHSIMLET
jgi:hypothetical protein